MATRLTALQRTALEQVAEGRVTWQDEYPGMARKAWEKHGDPNGGHRLFKVDGEALYRQAKATLHSLSDRELIAEDFTDVETIDVPERTTREASVSGQGRERTTPAHTRPAPWAAVPVVLTHAGREALAQK